MTRWNSTAPSTLNSCSASKAYTMMLWETSPRPAKATCNTPPAQKCMWSDVTKPGAEQRPLAKAGRGGDEGQLVARAQPCVQPLEQAWA